MNRQELIERNHLLGEDLARLTQGEQSLRNQQELMALIPDKEITEALSHMTDEDLECAANYTERLIEAYKVGGKPAAAKVSKVLFEEADISRMKRIKEANNNMNDLLKIAFMKKMFDL